MALSSKISSIIIRPISFTSGDWSYTIVPSNFDVSIGQVNFTEAFDEALDGSLRSNIRGFRLAVTLDWQKLISSTFTGNADSTQSTMGGFLTDVVSSLVTDGDSAIAISFDGGSNYHNVIPSDSSFRTVYTNQIGRGQGNLTLIGQALLTSPIPTSLSYPSV